MNGNARAWILKAEHDYETVELLRKEKSHLTEIICFHCQQCIEKYIKALFITIDVTFPKTHDLVRLCQMYQDKQPDSDINMLKVDLVELNEYAVGTRYPGEIVDIDDVNRAVALMKHARKISSIQSDVEVSDED